jgi:ABC-type multidrug transport system permease subunit
MAGVCASLFHGVTLDIAGFQGRMGLFFFILALFGFSSLTAITIFSEERILFMRERSNNYYSPFSYFLSKTILDIFPLRILPPFILSCIIYYPVGLVPTLEQFWKFVLVLIAFNLVSFSLVLLISLVCEDVGVANLVGSLIMLFKYVPLFFVTLPYLVLFSLGIQKTKPLKSTSMLILMTCLIQQTKFIIRRFTGQ